MNTSSTEFPFDTYMDSVPHCNVLSELSDGCLAEIREIDAEAALAERLGDLGLHPGTRLQCLRTCFLGDPVAYRVAETDTVLAIRKQDSAHITVCKIDNEGGGKQPWA